MLYFVEVQWGEQLVIFVLQWWYLCDFFLFWPITLHLLVFVSFIWCQHCLSGVGRHLLKHSHACQVTLYASKWPHLSCTCVGKETFAGEDPRAVFVQQLHVCMWAFQRSLREAHCVWTRVVERFSLIKDSASQMNVRLWRRTYSWWSFWAYWKMNKSFYCCFELYSI